MEKPQVVFTLEFVKVRVGDVFKHCKSGVGGRKIAQFHHAIHLKVDDSRDRCVNSDRCVDSDRTFINGVVTKSRRHTCHDASRRLRRTQLKHNGDTVRCVMLASTVSFMTIDNSGILKEVIGPWPPFGLIFFI